MTRRFLLPTVIGAAAALCAAAQESASPSKAPATELSPGVPAVIRLVQAGIPPEMLVRAIETSGVTIEATPGDLTALKQAGAADEVIRAITAGRHGNTPNKDAEIPTITLRRVRR